VRITYGIGTPSSTRCEFTGWNRGLIDVGMVIGNESSRRRTNSVRGYCATVIGNTYGVYEATASEIGSSVYGVTAHVYSTNAGAYGTFNSLYGNGVYYSGGLAGTGAKSCVARTSQGPTLFDCQESPKNWLEDSGDGQLSAGSAHIELDPLFLETVTIDEANPMRVFAQLKDDCNRTFVRHRSTGFDVYEIRNGTSSAEFSYRVVATRKGFESKRLDYCEVPEIDSYLYPELRQ
jgi:hypothetical protein